MPTQSCWEVLAPAKVRWYPSDDISPEEKEEVLRLNKERGKLPLIEYRNSKIGRNDEMAHEKELTERFYMGINLKRIWFKK
jgi:hypothetical protein